MDRSSRADFPTRPTSGPLVPPVTAAPRTAAPATPAYSSTRHAAHTRLTSPCRRSTGTTPSIPGSGNGPAGRWRPYRGPVRGIRVGAGPQVGAALVRYRWPHTRRTDRRCNRPAPSGPSRAFRSPAAPGGAAPAPSPSLPAAYGGAAGSSPRTPGTGTRAACTPGASRESEAGAGPNRNRAGRRLRLRCRGLELRPR